MKSKQVVGIVLGIILISLAIAGYLMGSIDVTTSNGQISIIAAILLGIIVIANSLVSNKANGTPETTSMSEMICPSCGIPVSPDLDLCPGCETALPRPQKTSSPPLDEQPARRHGLTQKQSAIVVVAVVVVVMLAVLSYEGIIFNQNEEWDGTCTYYYLDLYGERDSRITGTCELSFTRDGDSVSGILDIYPTHQQDVGPPGYLPAVEEHIQFNGVGNSTVIQFYIDIPMGLGVGSHRELWEFTISGDSMSGKVTNLDTYTYLGLDSDPGAFVLSK